MEKKIVTICLNEFKHSCHCSLFRHIFECIALRQKQRNKMKRTNTRSKLYLQHEKLKCSFSCRQLCLDQEHKHRFICRTHSDKLINSPLICGNRTFNVTITTHSRNENEDDFISIHTVMVKWPRQLAAQLQVAPNFYYILKTDFTVELFIYLFQVASICSQYTFWFIHIPCSLRVEN